MTADLPARDAASEVVEAVHHAISEQGYPRLTNEDAGAVAAAVLRWAADKLAAEDDRTEMGTGQRLYGTADYRVRGMADEIDGGTDG